jgi:lysophospholipase
VRWVNSALKETFQLSKLPSPNIPCITFLAEDERIVDPARVHDRMKVWPNGILHFMHLARHEILMEDVATQEYVIQKIVSFFQSNDRLIIS